MKDVRYVIDWLEEEIAHFEMSAEQHNYVNKVDEIRYQMAQELLAWILEYKFDPRYSSPVSRVPSDEAQDTKAFGSRT